MMCFRTAVAGLLLFGSLSLAAQQRPLVESIEPAFGDTVGGTVVTIRGKFLVQPSPRAAGVKPACTPICPPDPPVVRFGGKKAELQSYTSEQLIVKTPPSAGGKYDLQISTYPFSAMSEEGSVVLPHAFRYGPYAGFYGVDRLLVPVVADHVPGAFGSLWSTELVVRNDNEIALIAAQTPLREGSNIIGWSQSIERNSTLKPQLSTNGGGAFLVVTHVDDHSSTLLPLAANLRVRDLSRQADSSGTEVPLVRMQDTFIARPMNLLNVPIEPESRVQLRVYDFDGPTGGEVPVRVLDQETNAELASTVLHLPPGQYVDFPPVPGYASLDVKSILSEQALDRVRIEVGARNLQKRLWAMISVTDLETQQFTLITPQK